MRRGYLYYIFPVITIDNTEFEAITTAWQWRYFSWFFFFMRSTISFLCNRKGVEPLYVIYIPKVK
jgi:hypothetical protein